ncbi:aldose 1-epimerase [Devosia sp.]|jgi:aldose 1-epimerase|uniref:aldose 1-epimerase n=1 Tax=Devosia sp. TaxID=1871048 RepID=UPI0037C17AE7
MGAISDSLKLQSGRLSVECVPLIGGSIASFRFDGIDLMRPLSDEDRAAGNVLGVASFPMIPFANRIGNNAFTFEGKTYRFEMNNPPEIYHVHGTAWHSAWQAEQLGAAEARLELAVIDPLAYSYHASQHFQLDQSGLTLVTTVTNLGAVAMPFGFGHHPWFARDPDTTVQFGAQSFHLNEPEMMIGQRVSLAPEVSFNTPQPLPNSWRCTDYGGWNGTATVTFPNRGVGLTMTGTDPYKHIMFYADPARTVFCIEPQTNASGAFNRPDGFGDPDDGIVILQPNGKMSGGLRFQPFRV